MATRHVRRGRVGGGKGKLPKAGVGSSIVAVTRAFGAPVLRQVENWRWSLGGDAPMGYDVTADQVM